jgi:hypothetical protein
MITPFRCQFLRHSWCYNIRPDNLELFGVVCFAQDENTRSHSDDIAGTAKKLNAIAAR